MILTTSLVAYFVEKKNRKQERKEGRKKANRQANKHCSFANCTLRVTAVIKQSFIESYSSGLKIYKESKQKSLPSRFIHLKGKEQFYMKTEAQKKIGVGSKYPTESVLSSYQLLV